MIVNLTKKSDLYLEAAYKIIMHISSSNLIELICTSAKNLGFDAIYGHEVDRHSYKNKVVAQP